MGNRLNGTSRRSSVIRKDSDRRIHEYSHRDTQRNGEGGGSTSSGRGKRRRKEAGINSCPDLVRSQNSSQQWQPSGLTGRVGDEPPVKCEYKIYRSYSDLNDSKRSSFVDLPPVEVKVYRRSTERLSGSIISTSGGIVLAKAQSLPRGIERMTGGVGPGSLAASQDLSASYYPSHPPSSCSGGSAGATDVTSRQTSRRTSARSSVASVSTCRVSPEDFPTSQNIKRKLTEFESYFRHSLLETFQCLPPLNQLSCLSLATRPDRAHQSVSLLQYLESESIPDDLHLSSSSSSVQPSSREYFLTVSMSLFERARQIRTGTPGQTGSETDKERLALARDIASDIAREVSLELCRMFEYQISLIQESIALRMLARYAVDCVYDTMKRRQKLLDRNTVVQGAVKGRPRDSSIGTGRKLISVIIGAKELKWNIYDIFKRPGLRRDLFSAHRISGQMLNSPISGDTPCESRGSMFSVALRDEIRASEAGPLCGWRFYTAAHGVEPMLYGYRGQMVEWDYVTEHYKLNSEEETNYCEEVSLRYDDFHRLYCPYMWLIGLDTVQDYIAITKLTHQNNQNISTFSNNDQLPSTSSNQSYSQQNQTSNQGQPYSRTNHDQPSGSQDSQSLENSKKEVPTLVEYVKSLRIVSGSNYTRDDIKLVFRPLRAPQKGDLDPTASRTLSMALVGSAASEITKACEELRFKLDNLNGGGGAYSNGGGVTIQVTCPDGQKLSPCVEYGAAVSDL